MKSHSSCMFSKHKYTRRNFLKTAGAVTAGLLINPFKRSKNLYALTSQGISDYSAQVAVTQAFDYSDPALIKQKVQHLFEVLGGISDVVSAGDKVGVKINLTGGSSNANNPKHQGKDITETMWTHPTVLRAVCELLLDSGVNANDLYIVEAIWDAESYINFGYKTVQDDLGIQFVNLNEAAPYADFMAKETGDNHYYYDSFTLNRILDEINVYVSIPKMKQHYDAGVTHTMKNQIGITPLAYYYQNGYRGHLHFDGGNIRTHLPRSIVDLNLARPVNLGVVDGILTAYGGEGVWNPTFEPIEYDLLLAGKDPVATDSICSFRMDNDPEANKFQLPSGEECDNYLILANQIGMGTNILSEIELVGDGAHLLNISDKDSPLANVPDRIKLHQNYPNPFNPSTTIKFDLPKTSKATLKIFNILGEEVNTLISERLPAGSYSYEWSRPAGIASGMYLYRLEVRDLSTDSPRGQARRGYVETRRMVLMK